MDITALAAPKPETDLSDLSDRDLDTLPYGVVLLDGTGRILKYNRTEAEICNRDRNSVIGRNFFTNIAPCTNTRQFKGKFDEGIRSGRMHTYFQYTFDYRMNPTRVNVHLKKAHRQEDRYWVIIKRL